MTGSQFVRNKVRTFAKKFPKEVRRALYVEVELEVKEVKRRTPVERGNLRGSVHQVMAETPKGQIVASSSIVVGGPAAPYAIYVHEDLEALHKVGQAKYLESVVMEARPHMAARVARRIEIANALS